MTPLDARSLTALILLSSSVLGCDVDSSHASQFEPIEYDELAPTGKADGGQVEGISSLSPGDRVFVGALDERALQLDLRAGETVEIDVRALGRLGDLQAMRIAVFDPQGEPVLDLEAEEGETPELLVSAEIGGIYRVGIRSWATLYDVQTRCADCSEVIPSDTCTETVTYFAGATAQTAIDYDIDIDSCNVVGLEGTRLRFLPGPEGNREVRLRPGAMVRGWEHMNFGGSGFLRAKGTEEAPIVFEDYDDDYATVILNLPAHMQYVDFGRANLHVNADLHLEDAVLRYEGRFDKSLVINGTSATIERSLLDGFEVEIRDYERADVYIHDSVIRNVEEAVKVVGSGGDCSGSHAPWPRYPFSGDPQIVRTDIYGARYPLVVRAPTQVVVEDSNLVGGFHTIRLDVDGLAPGSRFAHSNLVTTGSPVKLESRHPDVLLSSFEDVYLGDSETPVESHCRPLSPRALDVPSRTDAWIDGLGPSLDGLRVEVAQAVYRR